MVLFVFLCLIMQYLFFQPGTFEIEQIQVIRRPTISEQFLKLRILFEVYNRNVQPIYIDKVLMTLTIISTAPNQRVQYCRMQAEPIKNFTGIYVGSGKQSFEVIHTDAIMDMRTFSLFHTYQAGYRVDGKILYSVSGTPKVYYLQRTQYDFAYNMSVVCPYNIEELHN